MEKQVLCFGEVLWDGFGADKKAGGAPMNVAMHLLQQQIPVQMLTRIGKDDLGDELLAYLQEQHFPAQLIQRDAELPTCLVTVSLDEDLQAKYVIPKPVSWDNIQPEKTSVKEAFSFDVIVFGSLACRSETSFNTLLKLLEKPAYKIFDVNLRPPHFTENVIETLAQKADMVKMNEEEMLFLSPKNERNTSLEDQMREFSSRFHTKTVCVTLGGHGCTVLHQQQFYKHPGFKVKVADTVGAGDSFLATFIAGLLNNLPMEEILVNASAIGAFVAGSQGANPVYHPEKINAIKQQK
ncbi:carbohydrate kinase family protein [Mucilaginibacter arboris]|uniref:Carbohydrate kinase n=1 Tax=Mucilaginibacter arboris TaxID=2682090 RepID=A0A7K1SSL1_9SPHI|nr:carbohydrate kinase [Mucilaginibacter arboris]MVN20291.1 carbohydrate kinase [Mucilaginibacter arboris]